VKAPAGWKKKTPVFSSPARTMRNSRILVQKTKATTVATSQPIAEMMRARRRSSRCSTIDMRPSGLRCEDEDRPLSFRAIAGLLPLLVGLGLVVGGRGRGGGGLRRRVLLVDGRPHL